jgi:hypothetical protein
MCPLIAFSSSFDFFGIVKRPCVLKASGHRSPIGRGPAHQNTSFVECGRSARPHSTKLGCFAVFGVRRTGAALRVGLPSLGPGAVVRPRLKRYACPQST